MYLYEQIFFLFKQAQSSLYLLSTNKQCHLSKINGAIFSPNKSMTYRVQIRKNKLKCCYSVKLRVHKLTFYSSFEYFYRISYSQLGVVRKNLLPMMSNSENIKICFTKKLPARANDAVEKKKKKSRGDPTTVWCISTSTLSSTSNEHYQVPKNTINFYFLPLSSEIVGSFYS